MNRLVCSTLTVLCLLSLTIGDQRRPRTPDKVDQSVAEQHTELPDECSTPGRPKPEVAIGLNGSFALCGRAISLPKPAYPEEAKAQKISRPVRVDIVIDENGKVIWAEAVDGHPLLREVSVKAACNSLHSPMKISGRAVKAGSVITYSFASE